MQFRLLHTLSFLLLLYLMASEAAVVVDKNHGKQGAAGILSFFTGPNRTTAKPGEATGSASNSLSSLTNLASGIQSIPSFQSILDATGITRLTDPIYNQARKRWQQLLNSDLLKRLFNPVKDHLQKRKNHY